MTTVDFFAKCDRVVVQPAVRIYEGITSNWNALDRVVSKWSDNTLPVAWSEVAKKIFHSLPIAAAIFMTPLWFNACMGGMFYIADLGYGRFEPATYHTIFTGAYIGLAAKAVFNATEFISSWHPKHAIYAIVHGVAGYLLFQRAHLQKI